MVKFPIAAIIAVGVAKTNAHGQNTTSIVTALKISWVTIQVPIEQINAPTTIHVAHWSAAFTILAFSGFEDSINLINLFTELSSPFFVALMIIEPYKFIVPLYTSSSTLLSTGSDSPVSTDWFIEDSPSIITPSAGIISPGKTFMRSLILIFLASISSSVPLSFIKVAVVGLMSIKFSIPFWVLFTV